MTKSINGLLLVDKPQGLTSHDVVARVRRILRERRVGHAGTLDPMATGLLVIAVGASTRLLRFAQDEDKIYTGRVQLGTATDSLDADGAVTAEASVPTISQADADAAAARFLGDIDQVPPMVSAIKVGGRRLHELAREGIEVERAPRRISIHSFTLTSTDDPTIWEFRVVCSVGTYVRVLLAEWASALGTLGHLVALRRESSGGHSVDDALTIEDLETAVAHDQSVLAPPRAFVEQLPELTLNEQEIRAVRMGQRFFRAEMLEGPEIAALDAHGALVAMLRRREDYYQPDVVFGVVEA